MAAIPAISLMLSGPYWMGDSMFRTLLAASLLVCFGSAPGWAGKKPADYPNHIPPCEANPADTVADFSVPLNSLRIGDKTVFETLKSFGIKTIIRYYDHDDETLICKTLLNDEAKAIIDNGFQLAVVFQHHNGRPATFFSETRGTDDAKRALALAKHNGQPPNTTIFFGVDGPDQIIASAVYMYGLAKGGPITPALAKKYRWTETNIKQYNEFLKYGPERFGPDLGRVREKDILPYVVKYFEQVAKVFKASSDE
jgi:hypothetical protein